MALFGARELKSNLKGINRAVNNALRGTALAGARIIRDEARRRAPVGAKRKKKIVAERKRGLPGVGVAVVGIITPSILTIIHAGAKPHPIRARTKKVLRTSKGVFLGVEVPRHPGIKATPFMASVLL